MTFSEIEELIRKYLSTGVAVVVVFTGSGTADSTAEAPTDPPDVVTVEPDAGTRSTPAPTPRPSGTRTPAPSSSADSAPGTTDRPDAEEDDEDTSAPPSAAPTTTGATPGGSGQGGLPQRGRTGNGGSSAAELPDSSAPRTTAPRTTAPGSGAPDREDTGAEADTDNEAARATGTDRPTDEPELDDTGSNDTAQTGTESDEQDSDEQDSGNHGSASGDSADPDVGEDSDTGEDRTGAGGSDPETDESGSDPGPSSTPTSTERKAAPASTGEAATAAEQFGWGTPAREDDFSGTTDGWQAYEGTGHGGKGKRSPSAVTITDGLLTITGDAAGTTGGMAWTPGRAYGRWEGRVRALAADPSYNALLLLWPDAEDVPAGGEIDFMEMQDPTRQKTDLFIHHGADNRQVNGQVEIDATSWHNWAVEWTPDSITAYVDGKEWYRTTDRKIIPSGPMHLCIQLDWFPTGGTAKESTMQVDWVREYAIDATGQQAGRTASEPEPVGEVIRKMFTWR